MPPTGDFLLYNIISVCMGQKLSSSDKKTGGRMTFSPHWYRLYKRNGRMKLGNRATG